MTLLSNILLAWAATQSGEILTDSGRASVPADPDVVAATSIGSNACPAVRINAQSAANRAIAAYAHSNSWAVEAIAPTYITIRFGAHADVGRVTTFLRKLRKQDFGVTSAPNIMLREAGRACPTSASFSTDIV